MAARFLEDLSKMIQAEIHLAELGLRNALQAQIDQMLATLAVAGLVGCALLCVLAAVVLLLHHWIDWWAAFALTALLSALAALVVRSRPSRTSAPPTENN
ncbi:MAG TPA: phage holin family protein [Candidatus Binataceae bacterium]|nr:phage holin family protein [Candidatus Binataceae bacterium]